MQHLTFFLQKQILQKLIGKHLYQNLFLNKVAGLRPATLLKKRFWHRCFPANFTKFLRTPFLQNISRRLLLSLGQCRNHCRCCNQLPSYRLLRPFVALNYNFWISSHFFKAKLSFNTVDKILKIIVITEERYFC